MLAKILWFHLALTLGASWALAQTPSEGTAAAGTPAAENAAAAPSTAPDSAPATRSEVTRTSKGSGTLPNEHGQQWIEYDISPYTSRVTSVEKPEQAIIDWILRETGTDVWFTEPLGILSASRTTLRVYHTSEMQQVVRDIVDRFNSNHAESHVFTLRLMTVNNPNWRTRAMPMMQRVSVQSPGVDAWLMTKENAAIVMSELRKRADFQEHSAPNLMIHNGQSQALSRIRPRSFVRSVGFQQNLGAGPELQMGQVNEGYSLTISPLLSLDQRAVDAVIKCDIDQVEKFVPIVVEVPNFGAAPTRVQVQIPQMVSWRLHERFRWPTDQVLLLSCGVVATPGPEKPNVLGIPNPFDSSPGRADALLFIESQGTASQAVVHPQRTATGSSGNHGRY